VTGEDVHFAEAGGVPANLSRIQKDVEPGQEEGLIAIFRGANKCDVINEITA